MTNKLIVRPLRRQRRSFFAVAVPFAYGQYAFVAVSLSLLIDPETRTPTFGVLAWLGLVVLAVKVAVAVVAFRAARDEGLLEPAVLREMFLFWLLLAAPVLCLSAAVLPGLGLPLPTGFVLLWTVILLPLGRFALIPLGLESARHR